MEKYLLDLKNVLNELTSSDEFKKLTESVTTFTKQALIFADATRPLTQRVSALGSAFNSLSTPLKVATIGFAAAGAAIHSTLKYASEGKEMAGLVRASGLAADKFQALENASKHYGGSAQATAQSLSKLRTGLADIQKGGNGNGLADTLKAFNINSKGIQSTEQFLTVIAGRMETLKSETEKLDFGRALGLDDATIKTLSGGIETYTKNLKDASKYEAFSPKDLKRAEELEAILGDISSGLYTIGANLAQLLLPVLTPVFSAIKGIVDFFASNSEMIKLMIIEIAAVIGSVLIPMLVTAAPAAITAFAPFLIVGAIIAGIIAAFIGLNWAIAELWKWLTGTHPIIYELILHFQKCCRDVINAFILLREHIISIFTSIKDFILKMLPVVGAAVASFFTGLWNAIKTGFGKLVEFVKLVVAKIMEFIPDWLLNFIKNGGTVGLLFKVAGKGLKALKDASAANGIGFVPFDGYMAELHKGEAVLDKSEAGLWRGLIAGKEAINLTANVPIASVPQGAITSAYNAANTSNSITLGDITIQTQATDADGIANELVQSIKMAFNGLDTGVRA